MPAFLSAALFGTAATAASAGAAATAATAGLIGAGGALTGAGLLTAAGTVAGLVGSADTARKARHSGEAQAADSLAAQKQMSDKTNAAMAEMNKPMPSGSGEGGDAKRKQEAQRLVASKYSGRGRSSTVMSDALG